jgi:hypothetical protein
VRAVREIQSSSAKSGGETAELAGEMRVDRSKHERQEKRNSYINYQKQKNSNSSTHTSSHDRAITPVFAVDDEPHRAGMHSLHRSGHAQSQQAHHCLSLSPHKRQRQRRGDPERERTHRQRTAQRTAAAAILVALEDLIGFGDEVGSVRGVSRRSEDAHGGVDTGNGEDRETRMGLQDVDHCGGKKPDEGPGKNE